MQTHISTRQQLVNIKTQTTKLSGEANQSSATRGDWRKKFCIDSVKPNKGCCLEHSSAWTRKQVPIDVEQSLLYRLITGSTYCNSNEGKWRIHLYNLTRHTLTSLPTRQTCQWPSNCDAPPDPVESVEKGLRGRVSNKSQCSKRGCTKKLHIDKQYIMKYLLLLQADLTLEHFEMDFKNQNDMKYKFCWEADRGEDSQDCVLGFW